jgi:hypothetical protein
MMRRTPPRLQAVLACILLACFLSASGFAQRVNGEALNRGDSVRNRRDSMMPPWTILAISSYAMCVA